MARKLEGLGDGLGVSLAVLSRSNCNNNNNPMVERVERWRVETHLLAHLVLRWGKGRRRQDYSRIGWRVPFGESGFGNGSCLVLDTMAGLEYPLD
jgi:hypothetical protein